MIFRWSVVGLLAGVVAIAGVAAPTAVRAAVRVAPAGQSNVDLLLEQGRRLFDAFNYEEAVPIFDRLITEIAAGGQPRPDVLVQAYSMRARSNVVGSTTGPMPCVCSAARTRSARSGFSKQGTSSPR